MKLAVLFSGGKDSTFAMYKAMEKGHDIVCLISIVSKNLESYMFHTPNINLTVMQAEAIAIPLIQKETEGLKEEELSDLKDAINEAKEKFGIEGIVTGAIESVYQASRIQKICDELNLECHNPLWKKDQIELLHELVSEKFEVIITGIFAYPLDEKLLGRTINEETISILAKLKEQYKISPSGEGGEIETTVLSCPIFKKKIIIKKFEKIVDSGKNMGVLLIKEVELQSI